MVRERSIYYMLHERLRRKASQGWFDLPEHMQVQCYRIRCKVGRFRRGIIVFGKERLKNVLIKYFQASHTFEMEINF